MTILTLTPSPSPSPVEITAEEVFLPPLWAMLTVLGIGAAIFLVVMAIAITLYALAGGSR